MRTIYVATAILALSLAVLVPAIAVGEANGAVFEATDGAGTNGTASIDRIEAWQAPVNATLFEDAADVRDAMEDGVLSRATGVDRDDVLVVEMELTGFDDAVSSADGSTTTERFQTAFAEHGDIEITQTDMGPNAAPTVVDPLGETGVTVIPGAANGTYYVTIDLADAVVTRNEEPTELDPDWTVEFSVSAELAADSPLTDGPEVAETVVAPRSATVETARDGRLQFRPLANTTVSGTTNLGTGSTVTLVLTGEANPETDSDESFELSRETTVAGTDDRFRYEGRFAGRFDLSDLSPSATNVTLDVRKNGESLLEDPVPAVLADRRAAVTAHDVVERGQSVGVNVTTTLSAGGFVVLHEETSDGDVVGHTPYLVRGDHTVTVYLDQPTDAADLVAVAYRDANHNEWFDGVATETAYTAGAPEAAVAFDSTLIAENASETGESTPATNGTPTPATNGTPTPATNGTAESGGETSSRTESPDSGTEAVPPGDSSFRGALPLIGVVVVATLLVGVARLRRD